MSINPWKLLLISLALAVWFDVLFYKSFDLGLNVFLFELAILVVLFGLAHQRMGPVKSAEWIVASFALMFSFTFAIWTSSIGLTLSGMGLLTANILLILLLFKEEIEHRHPLQYVHRTLVRCGDSIRGLSILSKCRIPHMTDKSHAVVRGLVVALPLLVIFALLFVGSDLILQRYSAETLQQIARFFSAGDLTEHALIIFSVTLVTLGVLAALFFHDIRPRTNKTCEQRFHTESLVVLIGLNVVFLAFIIFQSYYLFGGQAAWNLIDGISYSAYAVHGFNELAVVAGLVLLLLLTLRFFHGERAGTHVKWLEISFIGMSVLLLISAWMRMSLYVGHYGYTPARLFGFWFFLTVACVLFVFAVNIFRLEQQGRFIQRALVIVGSAALVFTMMAPDAMTVKWNIARAERLNEPMDVYPLFNRLSPEAYPRMQYVIREHNFTAENTEGWNDVGVATYLVERWNEARCVRVDEHGDRSRGTGKGKLYYRDRVTWKNWNFARTKMPACTL